MVKKTYKDHNALRHTVLIDPPAGGWCLVLVQSLFWQYGSHLVTKKTYVS